MARRIGAPWGCWPHEADPRTGTVEGLRNISFRRRSRIDPQRRRSARLTYLGVPLSTTNDDLARTEAPIAGAPSTEAPNIPPTFAALGVAHPIVEALAEHGITTAFPIQEMCLGLALEGRDVIGQAKTGTGKTLGFGIPLLQRIAAPATDAYAQLPTDAVGKPQALIVCPTRELALQVSTDLQQAGKKLGVRVLSVYGGRAYEPQIDALRAGVDVIVGTPGRIIDLATRGDLDLSHVRELVLDEADEMLDMGFLPDVERIVAMVPSNRQTMLFSATMPGQIIALARRYMNQPTHIRATDPGDDNATVDAIEQHVWRAHPMDKIEVLARVLQANGRGLAIIFTRTKRKAQKISDELTERGFAVGAVHGDLGQGAREQALRAFRSGKVDVLVATDVAARGIDVEGVTHVINYECPDDEKTYLHRIGRTGRAGASGVAVTLVDWEDIARWQMIDRALKLPFKDPLETYSTSPHIFTGLGIPEGTTGRLPKAQRTREGLAAETVEDLGETGKRAGKSRRDQDKPQRSRAEKPRKPERSGSGGAPRKADSQGEGGADKPRRRRRRTRSGSTDQARTA
ncbi:MAG: DEAD/DEAH box helicase [Actinomycetota bacterium]|nr:DEAD/DEAH box helicase [Actinomycetota bacterium]